MSKAIILVALVACALAASPFEQVRAVVQTDDCGVHGIETLRPKMENKIEELKANPQNTQAQADLLALVEDARSVYESCGIHQKIQPALGDAVEATGVAFLLASNCFKDVGVVLLIADTILQDPKNLTNDIIVSIILYIMGRQGYADCEQFLHFIV